MGRKQSNAEEVRENIESKAKFNREYPKFDVGDRVRIRLKAGKINEYKGSTSSWSKETYAIAEKFILNGQTFYKLAGEEGELMRHELQRIDDALVLKKAAAPKREGQRVALEQERVRPQLRPICSDARS